MKKLKNMKGITLVSLVITIIVLIILAAVSINLTIGSDGIITRAKEAAENMEIAALEEQEMLNTLYGQFDGSVENGGLSYDKITELRKEYDDLNTEYTNFKTQIAQAITNKGVETSNTDSVETMVSNINQINSGSTLQESVAETTEDTFGNYVVYDGTVVTRQFIMEKDYNEVFVNMNFVVNATLSPNIQLYGRASVTSTNNESVVSNVATATDFHKTLWSVTAGVEYPEARIYGNSNQLIKITDVKEGDTITVTVNQKSYQGITYGSWSRSGKVTLSLIKI